MENVEKQLPEKQKGKWRLNLAEQSMVELFQQLELDQCVQLFKQNYDNYSSLLKNKLYVVMGAKYVWGAEYKPNKNKQKKPYKY